MSIARFEFPVSPNPDDVMGAHAYEYNPEYDKPAEDVEAPAHRSPHPLEGIDTPLDMLVDGILTPAAEMQESQAVREDVAAQLLLLRGIGKEARIRHDRAQDQFSSQERAMRNAFRDLVLNNELSLAQQRHVVGRWLSVYESTAEDGRNLREYDELLRPTTFMMHKVPQTATLSPNRWSFGRNRLYHALSAPRLLWTNDELRMVQDVYPDTALEDTEDGNPQPVTLELPLTELADHIITKQGHIEEHVTNLMETDDWQHMSMGDVLELRQAVRKMSPSETGTFVLDKLVEQYFEYWLGSDEETGSMRALKRHKFVGATIEKMSEDLKRLMATDDAAAPTANVEEMILAKLHAGKDNSRGYYGSNPLVADMVLIANDQQSGQSSMLRCAETIERAKEFLAAKQVARSFLA